MPQTKTLFSVIFCAFFVFFVISSTGSLAADDKPAAPEKGAPKKTAAPEKPFAVKGVVEAAAHDATGKVTKIRIVAGEQKYKIAANDKGRELIQHVGKTVEATGGLKTKAKGSQVFTVNSFTIAEE